MRTETQHIKISGTLKTVLRGKFIALSSYIKKIKSQQLNDLTLQLKALEKEQINTKNSRREEIIKISNEINEIETKTIQKIDKTKSWYFEKVNKIDKPLATLTKRREIKLKLLKFMMKREIS